MRQADGAIVEAAAQVLEQYGYAAGTTNRIAERAGVSIGSLYQYFSTKDAILVQLVRDHVSEASRALAPLVERLRFDAPPLDAFDEIVDVLIDLHARRPALHRVLFEEAPLPADVRAELEAGERYLAAAVGDALDRAGGATSTLIGLLVVTTIEALTHGLVLRPPNGVDREHISAAVRQAVRALADCPDPADEARTLSGPRPGRATRRGRDAPDRTIRQSGVFALPP